MLKTFILTNDCQPQGRIRFKITRRYQDRVMSRKNTASKMLHISILYNMVLQINEHVNWRTRLRYHLT